MFDEKFDKSLIPPIIIFVAVILIILSFGIVKMQITKPDKNLVENGDFSQGLISWNVSLDERVPNSIGAYVSNIDEDLLSNQFLKIEHRRAYNKCSFATVSQEIVLPHNFSSVSRDICLSLKLKYIGDKNIGVKVFDLDAKYFLNTGGLHNTQLLNYKLASDFETDMDENKWNNKRFSLGNIGMRAGHRLLVELHSNEEGFCRKVLNDPKFSYFDDVKIEIAEHCVEDSDQYYVRNNFN